MWILAFPIGAISADNDRQLATDTWVDKAQRGEGGK